MRTKTLLLTAALAAAGVASSIAQSVYSVNVVGYVNVTCIPGYTFIQNPLSTTNNTITALLSSVPDGTQVLTWNASAGTFDINNFSFGTWDAPDVTFSPSQGFIVNNPSTDNVTVTFVGEVMQGANMVTPLVSGYNMVGSKVPQAGLITTDLNFTAGEGDQVLKWNPTAGTYDIYNYAFGSWDTEPTLGVGESCFISPVNASSWTRSFTIN